MSQQLTQKALDQSLAQSLVVFREDLKSDFVTKSDLTGLEERITNKFSNLQSSVDRYLKSTENWHQELVVVKARHERLSDTLVKKGIVSQDEISL